MAWSEGSAWSGAARRCERIGAGGRGQIIQSTDSEIPCHPSVVALGPHLPRYRPGHQEGHES